MTTFGNYDAGQSRPVSNPLFNGGLRKVDAGKTYDFGFNKVVNDKPAWGIERTTTVTPEERIGKTAEKSAVALNSVAAESENDRFVDEFLGAYITPETRDRMASTSFNVAMAMGDFEEAYKNLA